MPQPPRSVMQATRVLRGLAQFELADRVGVSQSTISQLESGAQRPEPDLADAAARALGIPVQLLGQHNPAPQLGHLLNTSLPRTARNEILASITMAHVHVDRLLGPHAVEIAREPGGLSYDHPHGFAERLRRRWSLPSGPLSGLIPTLEAHGIVCIYRNLSALRVPALASTAENGQTLVLLDTDATPVELAWAVAHELGHLAFGSEPSHNGEAAADEFAAAFLMPGRDMLDDDTLGPDLDLPGAAARWGVRTRTLAQRLRDLRKVTDLQFRALVRESKSVLEDEGPRSLLGTPAVLVDAVRSIGGSVEGASRMHLAVDDLRMNYLAGSRAV